MTAAGFSALFVRRPIFALVISMLIMIAGAAAFMGVQIRELPDVDRPVITVRTTYSGAAPETVDSQVTSTIEGAVARVVGLRSISSASDFGSSRVTLEFSPGTDLNVAANDVRDAVARVRRQLPDTVEEPSIVKADSDGQAIMQLSVTATNTPIEELTRFVEDEVVDRLASVEGVADVMIYGDREPVIRVTLDPVAMAARGLTVRDVESSLSDVAREAPAGALDSGPQRLIVRANANVQTAAEIAETYINEHTKVGDIALVEAAPSDQSTALSIDGQTGLGIGIIRQAQSNTLAISSGVRKAVAAMQPDLPEGVTMAVRSDEAVFIDGAVKEVASSLIMAIMIVIGVIYVFLRSARATLIPAVAVPISIIGTIAGIWIAGFSLNILTLLALVLATGMVVDDSIVVLENIVRRRQQGMGARAAAVLGVREVFFAVLTTTATLAAVFVPISFLPGTAGRLFAEFGYVLAMSVTISSFVALTLAPALAARVLTVRPPSQARWRQAMDSFGGRAVRFYERVLDTALKAPLITLAICLMFGFLGTQAFRFIPQELTPTEDRGAIYLVVNTPEGSSLDYTLQKMQQIEERLQPFKASGEVVSMLSVAGRWGVNRGFVVMPLAPWEERSRRQEAIAADMMRAISDVIGVQVFARGGNSLGIRGGGEGVQFAITGQNYDELSDAAEVMRVALQERAPRLLAPRLQYDTTQPQLAVRIDRERASDLGISVDDIGLTLNTLIDGRTAAELSVGDDAIPIEVEGGENLINDPTDLENVFVRSRSGAFVPLSSVASIEEMAVAPSLRREGQMRAVPMTANLATGYALRDAISDIRTIAGDVLPAGMGVRFLGEAAEFDTTTRGMIITFGFALAVILLVLAAQFESFVSAIIIMATVPFGLAAAVFAILFTGGTLNIYSQIGLVMIIGLMAKNGILLVEFANQLRDRGYSVYDAVHEAALLRLRPIMMTIITTVLGGLPLVIASGAGAEARAALGWIMVGGLGFATLFTLFLTPSVFLMIAGWSKPRAAEEQKLLDELAAAEPAE